MSDILCKWLNEEVRISLAIEPNSLDKNFSNGYLFGEVLFKYQLQKDFNMFTNKDTSVSKLNNFARLEPSLHLLGIPFDTNKAQAIIQEKQGVATHLLYQLYFSLGKKKKAQVRGIMQPTVIAGLHKKDHDICCDQLHQVRICDAELKKVSKLYEEKRQELNARSVVIPPIMNSAQQRRQPKGSNILEIKNTEKATAVPVPKPPPYSSQHNPKRRQNLHQLKVQEAEQIVQNEISQFETNRKKLVTYISTSSSHPSPGAYHLSTNHQDLGVSGKETRITLQSNDKFIRDIRKRLDENAVAREQREKRLQRFMIEQMKAREAQEETRRDEQLVRRLTRQTQHEQRLAAQLLQICRQKEVILENRLFREEQYRQRREKDLQEALEWEAALAQQVKLERVEEMKKELEICKKISAERAQNKYKKHFAICKDIVEQMIDFATKVGEYHQLTENLIPEKQIRVWKEMLLKGLPLYYLNVQKPGFEFFTPLDPVEQKRQDILNDLDYEDYASMVGEWALPNDEGEPLIPLTNNNILGHIVSRLRNFRCQPKVAPSSPPLPPFKLKACVLGKFCSGKTTCLSKISKAHGIYILSADTLIAEALNAYEIGEVTEQQNEDNEPLPSSSTPTPACNTDMEIVDSSTTPSTRALQGAAIQAKLKEGQTISTELLLDIIVHAIRQVPTQSCWILDGFPADVAQAHMLEKALGGICEDPVESITINLVADPNPPKPPSPPAPVLDLVVLLDIPDECVVQRAFSHIDGAASSSMPDERTLYLGQIQKKLRAFQEAWPKLEKWFDKKQNILVRVDADADEEELYKRLECVLQRAMMQIPEEKESDLKGAEVDQPHSEDAPGSIKSHADQKEQAEVSSGTTHNCEDVPETQHETGTTSASFSNWEYVDDPLPTGIPEKLCSHWDTMCCSYVNNITTVMQQFRSQNTIISHHLNNIREDYQQFLKRPDLKQESVSRWQKDFNSIPDDMRQDEETKAELHLRLDELCECLWDISNKRKMEDEKEMSAVMGEGFLEEHTALLVNNHSMLMQEELQRFQTTMSVLKVYYLSMSNQLLPEMPFKMSPIPLLDTTKSDEMQHQDERYPDSSKKLISDYEEALTTISNLMSNIAHKGKTEEQHENQSLPDEGKAKHLQAQNKNKKPLKQRDDSPPNGHDNGLETNNVQEFEAKIYKEYAAAQDHEEKAAKTRIALIKAHGLQMVKSLQSSAKQTSSCMQKWLKEHNLAGMKSIEQLADVTRHHIEAANKLQHEVVLDGTNFYMKEHHQKVSSPPPRPPSMETSSGFTLTISQLESVYQKFHAVAPLGLMPSSEFSKLLWNMMIISMDVCSLPDAWFKLSESQFLEIVALLTDEYELLDWRRFLLCAALPWPIPSSSQLLVVLQHIKSIDAEHTGYINETEYLQTELWFSSESVQPVPEDPSEPLPYDRPTNLRKFFFRLFADHSFSPPELDYVSMLQYLAAHPNPRQGFIRALSVVLGQHIRYPSPNHLVKSLPSIDEATELCSSDLDQNYREAAILCDSSSSLEEPEVSIPALLAVVCHKVTKITDDISLPSDGPSQEEYNENLLRVFRELQYGPEDCVPFSVLSQHPFIQSLIENSTRHQLVDIPHLLLSCGDDGKANSSTPPVNTGL
ncbi:sperm flagellar protein 2 isoform X3 [Takifugu rubripes]|uniref:sperm flagellar protein 2 isoform X3 n=1 Tax=Takifugu rubripes TaxID=31033 RepID=UPI001145F22B|nr:sperm flagellar protein 2 isoform X3 [Takifugu rubripes]